LEKREKSLQIIRKLNIKIRINKYLIYRPKPPKFRPHHLVDSAYLAFGALDQQMDFAHPYYRPYHPSFYINVARPCF
jgi:hypothetical protein